MPPKAPAEPKESTVSQPTDSQAIATALAALETGLAKALNDANKRCVEEKAKIRKDYSKQITELRKKLRATMRPK